MIVDHKDTVRRRLRRTAISLFTGGDLVREIKGEIQIAPVGPENSIYSTLGNAKIRGTLMC
jgi:hypothetical protein